MPFWVVLARYLPFWVLWSNIASTDSINSFGDSVGLGGSTRTADERAECRWSGDAAASIRTLASVLENALKGRVGTIIALPSTTSIGAGALLGMQRQEPAAQGVARLASPGRGSLQRTHRDQDSERVATSS